MTSKALFTTKLKYHCMISTIVLVFIASGVIILVHNIISSYRLNKYSEEEFKERNTVYLPNPECFDVDYILKWIKSNQNTEILEGYKKHLLNNHPNTSPIIFKYLNRQIKFWNDAGL